MTTSHRRVNPFVGVPETTLRFVLLALVTLAASAYAWQYIHQVINLDTARARLLRCATASLTEPSPPYRTEQARCWAENMAHPLALSISVGALITVAVTALVVAVLPRLRTRRDRLSPAPSDVADLLQREVGDVAARLGVPAPPILVLPRPVGTAYLLAGGVGRPRLVLGEGLVLAARQRPELFRAVVAHELGHVRNADVRLAELAVATWWSLVLTVLVPYAVAALASGYLLSTIVPMLKLVAVVVLARLLRNALLRSRELEADIRASCLPDVRRSLLEVFASRPESPKSLVLSTHPRLPTRSRAITEPGSVLRASGSDLATLAATAYFLVPGLAFWVQQFVYGLPISTLGYAAPAWLVAAGLGAGLWALGWREAVSRRVTGQQGRPIWLAAVALTVGFFAGVFLEPFPRDGGLADRHTAAQWVTFVLVSVVGGAVVLGLSRAMAHRLVARVRNRLTQRLFNWAGMIVVALVAALALDLVRTLLLLSQPGMSLTEVVLLTAIRFVMMPATWIASTAAAAVLILVLRQPTSPASDEPAWMLLPESAEPTELARQATAQA